MAVSENEDDTVVCMATLDYASGKTDVYRRKLMTALHKASIGTASANVAQRQFRGSWKCGCPEAMLNNFYWYI